MKINDYNATLDEKMSEFDMWVTPSLGEIRDTPQFRVNLEQLKKGFDYMADYRKFCRCITLLIVCLSGKRTELSIR